MRKIAEYIEINTTDTAASVLKVLMIGVFPLAYLGYGVCVAFKRRRPQHEPV